MKRGTSTGSVEKSPARRKREAQRRRAEEARWAARSGPVTVRFVDPAELRQKPDQSA